MKRKKLWLIVSAVLLLLLTLTLVGCSTMGTLFNCFTNLIGCSLQTIGKCNTCYVPYLFWSGASFCTLCRESALCSCGPTCYDEACVNPWFGCGEKCKSTTCRDGGQSLNYSSDYPLSTRYAFGEEKRINDMISCTTMTVWVKFEGEDLKYDNVTVDCTVGNMTSSRWIGSAKSGKEYEVECEFYHNSTSNVRNEKTTISVYGEPVK